MFPSLFVSHGAPSLILSNAPARQFLADLPASLPARPKAIVMVSAHWETHTPRVSSGTSYATVHDFGGFPDALYRMRYPAPGDPGLAAQVADLLGSSGHPAEVDDRRGLDHGAWVPLKLMYPEADIPVVQLSVQRSSAKHHIAIGHALAPLRDEGVLIIGSGSFTHDLASFRQHRDDAPHAEPEWVAAFADWFDQALQTGQLDNLADYRRLAPFARRNHPTEEHLMPLFVALGAAGPAAHAARLHASVTHAVLRMDAYAFGVPSRAPGQVK